MSNIGVHVGHCCIRHGCKYGDNKNCPVVTGMALQDFPCEYCDMDRDELREILMRADPEEIAAELRKLGYVVEPPSC